MPTTLLSDLLFFSRINLPTRLPYPGDRAVFGITAGQQLGAVGDDAPWCAKIHPFALFCWSTCPVCARIFASEVREIAQPVREIT